MLNGRRRWRASAQCQVRPGRGGEEFVQLTLGSLEASPFWMNVAEGSLEVKLPTIWTDEKQRWEESEKRREEERRSKKWKSPKKEDRGARKGRKVTKLFFFPKICGSGGSKSRLAKAAGAEPSGQMRDEKLHAVVAQSTFRSQNVQSTSASEHFLKVTCRKSARRCGAQQISKSKCTKHLSFGALLEVDMSKKCTPLWREAHLISKSKCTKHLIFGALFEVDMSKKCTPSWREAHVQVKMYKAHDVRSTFGSRDVEKAHAVVARSTFRSQNVQSTSASEHL